MNIRKKNFLRRNTRMKWKTISWRSRCHCWTLYTLLSLHTMLPMLWMLQCVPINWVVAFRVFADFILSLFCCFVTPCCQRMEIDVLRLFCLIKKACNSATEFLIFQSLSHIVRVWTRNFLVKSLFRLNYLS